MMGGGLWAVLVDWSVDSGLVDAGLYWCTVDGGCSGRYLPLGPWETLHIHTRSRNLPLFFSSFFLRLYHEYTHLFFTVQRAEPPKKNRPKKNHPKTINFLLEMLLAAFYVLGCCWPRPLFGFGACALEFVEDTITQERGSVRVGYLLLCLYFSFCSLPLFYIL